MNSNDLLKEILVEQKKTNELLKTINKPIVTSVTPPIGTIVSPIKNPIIKTEAQMLLGGVEITSEGIKKENTEVEIRWNKDGFLSALTKPLGLLKDRELVTLNFSADHISAGTLKEKDILTVDQKLDKLSVLGMIDRYAEEQAEERIKKSAQIADTPKQFKKFAMSGDLRDESKSEQERYLDFEMRKKVKEVLRGTNGDELNKLFQKYKQTEEN